jgi:chromosome segregation ATPase
MMLVCYQNEIIALQGIIAAWNDKVLGSIQKDADLRNQLEPLQNELTQYMATSKQDQKLKKKEISALKKQCDNIGKERKQLAKQMEDDSGKLAEELTKMKTEVQGVVKERFTDIIENIQHSYQDKFNL